MLTRSGMRILIVTLTPLFFSKSTISSRHPSQSASQLRLIGCDLTVEVESRYVKSGFFVTERHPIVSYMMLSASLKFVVGDNVMRWLAFAFTTGTRRMRSNTEG